MAVQDSADRFDYLFEPIDAETTAEVPAVDPVESVPRARRWWPLPVVAAMVALAGAVVLIESWPGPGDIAPGPNGSPTHLVPTPIVTSVPVVEAPPEPVSLPEATANVMQEPAPVSVAPPPPPAPPPAPSPSAQPDTRQAPPPILRSPNSVSPEPRPAFPNQQPPDGDDQGRGGLLGRLGL